MIWLSGAFLVTALLYASVGFGGGSTYAALLALAELDYRILPLVALACNVVVVAGGSWRFARAGITPWRGALAVTAFAAPAALLGGLTPIDREPFMLLLGGSLLVTGTTLLVPLRKDAEGAAGPAIGEGPQWTRKGMPLIAAPLGYLAGLVGIGGGIFLAPLLHLARWDNPRAIAATASLFILVNSLFGIAGQILKGGADRFAAAVGFGLPLMLAVAIGGWVGSLLAVRALPAIWIRRVTAALTIYVGARILIGM